MLRLITTPFLNELWRHGIPRAAAAAERQLLLLPSNRACPPVSHHRGTSLVRHITSGTSGRKDVPQPKTEQAGEKEKIDLDIWKSVMMRSQLTADEKHGEEGLEGDVGPGAQEGNGKEDAPTTLDDLRELVVMWRSAGKMVPEHMTEEQVQLLYNHGSKTARKNYLKYLAIKEQHKKTNHEKKVEKRVFRMERMTQRSSMGDNEEGQQMRNSFLLQFWDRSMDTLVAWRNARYMTFGQPLVFDMSYDDNMSRRELVNAVNQMMFVEAFNRRAAEPFHLHYCNLKPNGIYEQEFVNRYGAAFWERLLITSTDRSYVDILPRERLVYLTADSPNVLHTFNHSKIYIIGGLVDRSIQRGLSFAKAKRLNLATARLPLDNYLNWDLGAKNLTLDQMHSILMTMKETGNWEKAFDAVPKRKHCGLLEQHPQGSQRRDPQGPRGPRATFVFNGKGPDVDGGVTNYSTRNKLAHKQGDDGKRPLRFEDRSGDETFRGGNRRFSHSHPDSELSGVNRERSRDRTTGLTGGRENEPAGNRVQTSVKSKMKNMTGRDKKPWWEDE